ncbi:Disease resistance protein family [Quillaja saponaria]|uniref:Disease resistance protein family n=1 Tax=Quillaja saponaria TaxID=32244 RepID=A0AAD7QAX2_QUISA|nr:Disease resistance protein family [Quillaja saponaria]
MRNSHIDFSSLGDLSGLHSLKALEIHIRDVGLLSSLFFFENLRRYKILVGDEWNWYGKFAFSRTLKLKLKTNIHSGIKMLLKTVEELSLGEVGSVRSVLDDMNEDGFPHLTFLDIQNNSEIQYIVDSSKWIELPNAFPMLESLVLHKLINLESIWHGQITTALFYKLKIIKVNYCDRLKSLISLSMVGDLSQLMEIDVSECIFMEEIVRGKEMNDGDIDAPVCENEVSHCSFLALRSLTLQSLPLLTNFYFDYKNYPSSRRIKMETETRFKETIAKEELGVAMPLFNKKVTFPNLETIRLNAINLVKIWDDKFSATFYFQNLSSLIIEKCANIEHLFSLSMATSLVELKYLEISECEMMVEILQLDKAHFNNEVVFPKLETAKDLPKLEKLQIDNCNSLEEIVEGEAGEQALKSLQVNWCPKAAIFTKEESFQQVHNQGRRQQPFFSVEKVIPKLEELALSGDQVEIVKHRSSRRGLFPNLKLLTLLSISKPSEPILSLVTLSKSLILKSLRYNPVLARKYSSLKVIDNKESDTVRIECPKKLALNGISEIEYIFKKGSWSQLVQIQNLQHLNVLRCYSLIGLAQGLVSLNHLKYLEICECYNLKSLVTSSTAKSFVQLTSLKISSCRLITNIVADEDEAVCDREITFSNLELLELNLLPGLESFCLRNHALIFPLLKSMFVIQCPKMKTFTPGNSISTPQLRRVDVHKIEDAWFWEGDLNATIHKLFTDMVAFHGIEALSLSEYPMLKDVWNNGQELEQSGGLPNLTHIWSKEPHGILDLKNLISLTICECHSLRNLFNSSMVSGLMGLQEMQITDCNGIEEIITKASSPDDAAASIGSKIIFPRLNVIVLKDLPNLTCFYSGSETLECPSLKSICKENCPQMKAFDMIEAPNTSISNISNSKISFPKLEVLELGFNDWSLQLPEACCSNIKLLKICTFGQALSPMGPIWRFRNLEQLHLEEIYNVEELNPCEEEVATDAFSKLEKLFLSNLPKLRTSLLSLAPSFENLTVLVVSYCEELLSVGNSSVATSLVRLTYLKVRSCEKMTEIIASDEGGEAEKEQEIVFHQLKILILDKLQRLARFSIRKSHH